MYVPHVGACMTFLPQAQARHKLKPEKKNDEVLIKRSFSSSKVQKSSTHTVGAFLVKYELHPYDCITLGQSLSRTA